MRRSTIVVIKDPLEALEVLFHHHVPLLLTMFSINIKLSLLKVVLVLSAVRTLCIQRDEFLDEPLVIRLRLGIDVGLRRH